MAGHGDDARRRLGDELPRLIAVHDVPGASVAVLVDDEVVEATAGVVNLRTGVAVTPDTLFMVQSVTKVWTATLVMQLVDDGLVSLDAPVRSYLPTFRTADEASGATITVRQLLTHTGGFEGDLWAPTTCGDDALERFVDDLVPLADQRSRPGEQYSYCNAGYGVLGRLVEVGRGTSYADALRRHLAEPLGVDELAFSADEALTFRTAIGHAAPAPGVSQQPLRVWAPMPPSNPAAGNQLAMSARGLVALGGLHARDGEAPDGRRLLSREGARAMREGRIAHPGALGVPTEQGLGWMVGPRAGLVEHGGGAIGVSALLRVVPEHRLAVAVVTDGEAGGRFFDDLLDPLLGELAGIPPASGPPVPARGGVSEPARYVGRYRTRVRDQEVTVRDGRLWLTETGRHEALDMERAAGVASTVRRSELRRFAGEVFVVADPSGTATRSVEFVGADDLGRARSLHSGRAAPRVG